MATIGVLTYTMPQTNIRQTIQSINTKTKSNISNNNNNNNRTNNNNETSSDINNITTEKQNLVIARKKHKIQPLTEAQTNVVSVNTITTTSIPKLPQKITKIASLDSVTVSSAKNLTVKNKGSSTLPLAVARRNARERNRVKQVNNGFAALRERIPDEVAECFETHGSRRDATKKLSKVETLRMAVEYIRSLEKVLEIDSESKHYPTINDDASSSSSSSTTTLSPLPSLNIVQPAEAQPMVESVGSTSNFEDDSSMIQENTSIAEITIINGHQYIRIPGTNTYHLLSAALYQNEENIQPLSDNNPTLSTLLQQQQQPQQQQHINNYESQSILMDNTNQIMTIANSENDIKPELYLLTNPSSFDGVLTLKTEITDDDILLNSQPLSTESMIENMEWWDSTVTHSNNSDDLSS